MRKVQPGQEAEIALKTHPGRIIKCKVDSIMWATAQGQLPIGGASTSAGAKLTGFSPFFVYGRVHIIHGRFRIASGVNTQGDAQRVN